MALSVAGLYSIITTLASISVIHKPQYSTKLLLHFAFWDVVKLSTLFIATNNFNPMKSFRLFLVPVLEENMIKADIRVVFMTQLILGILASATGTAGGIAYVGLKGNDHVQWNKVCNHFDKFCRHIGAALAVSLFASFLLIFLIWLNVNSLHKKIPK